MERFGKRLVGALLLLMALEVAGALGYILIEGASFHDAVYMAAITLTAVGYEEVVPLSPAGRNFTIALLLGGFTWMGIWFAILTSFVVELDLAHVFRRRRIMKAIEETSDHVVICGAGRTGGKVAEELASRGQEFVIIERNPDRVEDLLEVSPDLKVIQGDATTDQNLEAAGIQRARGLVASLSADTDNLFVCLSARDLNPDLTIVARAYEEETMSKLYRAGADHVVSPNVSSAVRMASVIIRPSVLSFLDVATRSEEVSLRLEEAPISEDSPLSGQTLAEARIPEKTGLIVIALRKADDHEEFVYNPVAETRLEPGDALIVLGGPDEVRDLRKYTEPR